MALTDGPFATLPGGGQVQKVVPVDPATGAIIAGGSSGGAVTVADGANVAQGAVADAAYTGSGSATIIAALKGLYASMVGQGTTADAAYAGTGNSSVIAALKGLYNTMIAATPAGENHVGEVGGKTDSVSPAAPTITASSAYASGQVIGTKMTLANLARVSGKSGVIQTVSLFCKSAQTAAVDVLIFNADPSSTTFTDKTALALAAADYDKLIGVAHVTDWTSLGTPSLGQAAGVGLAFKLGSGLTDGYAVLVSRGTPTFASTSDIKLAVKSLLD